ncbi:MAG: prepilin peptidase [Alphaproteobacteria bacterium]
MIFDSQTETLVFGVAVGDIFRYAVVLGFSGLLIAAAVTDLRRFIIPNSLVVALLALWPFSVALSGFPPVGGALLCALAVFVLAAGLFMVGFMGGGDVKLLTVLALWAGMDGVEGLFVMLLLTSVAGGALSVLWVSRWRPRIAPLIGWAEGLRDNRHIPYGVAIAAGGLTVARRLWVG